ncbi:MAG TPA: acetyl-CoA carboxylase biotin carboxyl carrier protein subunit, partial [Acidimicrobiales bacterium]|nr:acetyl-CoA carboxylase biotin carboxyl carrier protein subunit [Acidimicrobiales bacterium]
PARRRGAGSAPSSGGDEGGAVRSPMQGTVAAVPVSLGQQVASGEVVVVLEAMKMQQPLPAPLGGTVAELSAEVGAIVQAGQLLCRIEPSADVTPPA